MRFKLFAFTVSCFLFAGCAKMMYKSEKFDENFKVRAGMSTDEVLAIMGQPAKSDLYKGIDEWHYCKTKMKAGQYLAIFFQDNKVIAKKNYTVTLADLRGATGQCYEFVKMGNYREPDVVAEIRYR